jgi:CheY-like chemotaxis protein
MALHILVIEDAAPTSAAIARYLGSSLWRVGYESGPDRPDGYNGRDPHTTEAGALGHLLPHESWGPYRHAEFDVCPVTPTELRRLAGVAKDPEELVDELDKIGMKRFKAGGSYDVLVVDLALSSDEQEQLVQAGGNLVEQDGKFVVGPWDDEDEEALTSRGGVREITHKGGVDDIRLVIQEMTGYRVVSALGGRVPVVATTYAKNPLVLQKLLQDGAYAVVPKPLPAKKMAYANRISNETLERRARKGTDARAVVIVNYLMTLAAEVLKSASGLSVQSLSDMLPEGMSTDVIRDGVRSGDTPQGADSG